MIENIAPHELRSLKIWFGCSCALIIGVILSLSWYSLRLYHQKKALQDAYTTAPQQIATTSSRLNKKRERITHHHKQQLGVLSLLDQLELMLPDNARVKQIQYHYKQPCKLTLQARTKQALTYTLERLKQKYPTTVTRLSSNPLLAEVALTLSSPDPS